MANQLSLEPEDLEDDILWTKDKILSYVTQEEIFQYYLSIEVRYGTKFCSPLRRDKHPTCSFKRMPSGMILFRDWAEPRPKDCFGIVMEMFNVDFYTALEIIAKDLNLSNKEPGDGERNYSKEKARRNRPVHSEKSRIQVKVQPFTQIDKEYLYSYHLTDKILDYYNVYSAKAVWINGNLVYIYHKKSPAIAYFFGLDDKDNPKWKIYYYKSDEDPRFMGNTNRINGWIQIPEEGEDLVITKSMKDVMCLARFSIPAVAMQAETQIPYDYIIEELKDRYDNIYTLLDFDEAGIRSANIIKKKYNIPPLMLTDGSYGSLDFGYKDFSDFLQANGIDKTEELVEWSRSNINKHKMFPKLL